MRLTVESASKSFPGVQALDDVSLDLRPGEIHALMGENGAGKSTLIKIITGVYRPDEGKVLLDGRDVQFASPRDAIAAGISAVHQERNLDPALLGRREHPARTPADEERPHRLRRGRSRGAALSRPARPRHRHARRGPHPVGGADADRRDRQGAVARSQDPAPRRADRVDHRARDRGAVHAPSPAPRRRRRHRSSSATSSRRSSRSPTASPCCATARTRPKACRSPRCRGRSWCR